MRLSVLLLMFALAEPGQAQVPKTVGLGYGQQYSYQHPKFVTADFGVGVGRGWLLAPAARMAWNAGMTGLRMQLSLQHRLSTGDIHFYGGMGPSWTNEVGEGSWDSSELGAMGLIGFEARLGSALWLYGQLDGYTHHYATVQTHLGIRVHR